MRISKKSAAVVGLITVTALLFSGCARLFVPFLDAEKSQEYAEETAQSLCAHVSDSGMPTDYHHTVNYFFIDYARRWDIKVISRGDDHLYYLSKSATQADPPYRYGEHYIGGVLTVFPQERDAPVSADETPWESLGFDAGAQEMWENAGKLLTGDYARELSSKQIYAEVTNPKHNCRVGIAFTDLEHINALGMSELPLRDLSISAMTNKAGTEFSSISVKYTMDSPDEDIGSISVMYSYDSVTDDQYRLFQERIQK